MLCSLKKQYSCFIWSISILYVRFYSTWYGQLFWKSSVLFWWRPSHVGTSDYMAASLNDLKNSLASKERCMCENNRKHKQKSEFITSLTSRLYFLFFQWIKKLLLYISTLFIKSEATFPAEFVLTFPTRAFLSPFVTLFLIMTIKRKRVKLCRRFAFCHFPSTS